jgi:hypothetical protein
MFQGCLDKWCSFPDGNVSTSLPPPKNAQVTSPAWNQLQDDARQVSVAWASTLLLTSRCLQRRARKNKGDQRWSPESGYPPFPTPPLLAGSGFPHSFPTELPFRLSLAQRPPLQNRNECSCICKCRDGRISIFNETKPQRKSRCNGQ